MIGLLDGDVVLHARLWNTKNLDEAVVNVHEKINDWIEASVSTELVIALGGFAHGNYRDDLYPDYKRSVTRDKGRDKRVDHYLDCKRYISELPETVVCDNIEADDVIGHWTTQLGPEGVVLTVDKDLDQLPGLHYNFRKQGGRLYYVEKKEALDFLLTQLVQGDSIDNIPGLPGFGPKKSLVYLQTEGYSVDAVLQLYQRLYPDDWEDYLLSNGKLLFIQRHEEDWFTLNRLRELEEEALGT